VIQVAWLLFVHSIPPKPPYLRAKVMRNLTRIGALPLKRSAYLLPSADATMEDFQWLQRQLEEEGAEAWIVEARFVAGLRDEEIRDGFRAQRSADYRVFINDARALLQRLDAADAGETSDLESERRRLARRLEALRRIDFFHADGGEEAEALMAAVQRTGSTGEAHEKRAVPPEELRGRTWMTRAGVKVDRMASAWLIRRFIDPAATFAFAGPERAAVDEGVLRFDMFDGEFTHDGSRCTFEVLLDVVNRPGDRALAALGQIVHDLDLHDDRYQRPETSGVGALIAGLVSRYDSDVERLAASGPLFDALYVSLGGHASSGSEQQS
jgi:hypothetical protein